MGFISLRTYLSNLYTISILVFCMLLLEFVLMVQWAVKIFGKVTPSLQAEAVSSYMRLVADKYPATLHQSRPSVQAEPDQCSVCLCGFKDGEEIRKLQCRHVFHKECLDKWLQLEKNGCPICRRPVVEEEAVMEQLEKAKEYCEVGDMGPMFFNYHGGSLRLWFS